MASASKIDISPELKERIVKRYVDNPDLGWGAFCMPYRNMMGEDMLKKILDEACVRRVTTRERNRISKKRAA